MDERHWVQPEWEDIPPAVLNGLGARVVNGGWQWDVWGIQQDNYPEAWESPVRIGPAPTVVDLTAKFDPNEVTWKRQLWRRVPVTEGGGVADREMRIGYAIEKDVSDCDHFFHDTKACVKCRWVPPDV